MGEREKPTSIALFHKRVLELMEKKGWQPSELANYASISLETAKRYTTDFSIEPTIKIARSIAQALDTDLDYLVGIWDEETLFSRPQRVNELLINLFKSIAILYPAIDWYADTDSKHVVISPEHEYISRFFERINLDADETEIRSIVSKFVEDLENKFKDEPEEQPEEPTEKRALDNVVDISELSEFGERLKKFMLEENLSLPQLSERTGIPYDTLKIYFATEYTPSTASKKKKKPPTPKMSNAVELAKAFGFSLDYLLGDSKDRLLINQYSAAKGVFHNLYRMLQYANFTIRNNPESEEIEAVSSNRYLYYFFRRIQTLDSMDDLDEVIEETEKYCKDYKMVVSESGEIMLDDEYKDYKNSEIFNQINRTIAIMAALDHKERENEE